MYEFGKYSNDFEQIQCKNVPSQTFVNYISRKSTLIWRSTLTKQHKQPRARQNVYDTNYKQNTGTAQMEFHVRLSEVQRKTGAELVYNGYCVPNLGRHLLFCSQIPPHNALRDEFGTSLSMNFEKANSCPQHN